MVRNFEQSKANNYPPYNIVEDSDNEYTIEIAIAGFAEGDISITSQEDQLIISGDKKDSDVDRKYLHKDLAYRKWERTFTLGEYVEVTGASVENGILSVKLERLVPEAKKPKTIAIDYKG